MRDFLVALIPLLDMECKGNWALTGSVALFFWSVAHGLQCREPHDLDLLVKDGWVGAVATGLNGMLGLRLGRPPKPGAEFAHLDGSHVSIDVLGEGDRFGSLKEAIEVSGVKLILTGALKARKENILSEKCADEDAEKAHYDLGKIGEITMTQGGMKSTTINHLLRQPDDLNRCELCGELLTSKDVPICSECQASLSSQKQ
jgi:hypothetical protein